jgi:hypothetical protein
MKLNIFIGVFLINTFSLSFSIINPYGINSLLNNNLNSNLANNALNSINVGATLAAPQGTQVLSPEEKEVDRLVSKWSATGPDQGENYGLNMNDQTMLQSAENEINGDRVFLNSVLNKYPGLANSDLGNKIAQTLYVLDLQQIRLVSKEITVGQSNFYGSLQAYIKKIDINDPNGDELQQLGGQLGIQDFKPNPPSWYKHRKSELEALLLKFQNLLSTQPGLLQNPPPILAGLQDALSSGSEALTLITQQANCFTNPTDPICNIRPANNSSRNSGGGGGGYGGYGGYGGTN